MGDFTHFEQAGRQAQEMFSIICGKD